MQYKVGAEQLQQVPSLAHRPDGVFRVARTAPVGPTHAVDTTTGATVCGIKAEGLLVLDQDWEAHALSRSALAVSPPPTTSEATRVTGRPPERMNHRRYLEGPCPAAEQVGQPGPGPSALGVGGRSGWIP